MTWTFILVGLVAGIASGVLGIGGATVIVPLLLFGYGFSQHQAQGTSLAALVPAVGLFAAWAYYQRGQVNIKAAVLIAVGMYLGGWIGAQFAGQIAPIVLRKVFALFLMLVAVHLLVTP